MLTKVPKVAPRDAALGFQVAARNQSRCDALLEADGHKNQFLAMLAHELRNPLAPIRNMLEIMKRANGEGELIRPCLETMERQLGQMTRLIDDLLDVNRISRGKLELRPREIELAVVIRDAVESTSGAIQAAGHLLTVRLPSEKIYLRADAARLAQVFGNLINNACKFTPPGGGIALTAERRGRDVIVRVTDSGMGIPPQLLPRIFELFAQGDQTTERTGGLGIGLTLVERLVQMHGGSVEATSAGTGQGSEFVVRLPALDGKSTTTPLESPLGAVPAVTARRILVVDDNRDAANSLALLLTMTGHKTHTAYDGLEAVEAAASFKPDVVLLDIGLPKLDGCAAARAIRQQRVSGGIVMVALTGWSQAADRTRTEDAGFDAHLVKPVDHVTLMDLLSALPITL